MSRRSPTWCGGFLFERIVIDMKDCFGYNTRMNKYIVSNNAKEFAHPCVVISANRLTYLQMEVFLKSEGVKFDWDTFTMLEETDLKTFMYEDQ